MNQWLQCITCNTRFPVGEVRYTCTCGGLLAVERPPEVLKKLTPQLFDSRMGSREKLHQSGVWRFREGLLDVEERHITSLPEGRTHLYDHAALNAFAGVDLVRFKHEGENPTASFKDRGMTVAMTAATLLGATKVACASTGNTSASLAAYAARAQKQAVVFVPSGKISVSKMAQTLAYGARVLKVRGDFDVAMTLVQQAAAQLGIYLLNSVNPFRIEGQKTIAWEILQDLSWDAPDWIALPAGNLGNTSAVGKGLLEAFAAGWIKKVPRVLSVQAQGANPFYQSYVDRFSRRYKVQAETVASAIRIGDPVSHDKARAVIEQTRGVVAQVTDEELLTAKRHIDRAGIGCEPASACSLAGVKQLVTSGIIQRHESVVCILTGHVLKDPDAVMLPAGGVKAEDQITEVDATVDAVRRALAL